MKKSRVLYILLAIIVLGLISCAGSPRRIDTSYDEGRGVMVLDYRDFEEAASELVQSLIRSGRLERPEGGRYVMTQGRIVNDTKQRINTNQLMAKIEEELINSGDVVMTSAVGYQDSVDDMVYDSRELRESREFDRDTVAGEGQLIAPDLSISGRIIQRDIPYSRRETQVEYYFQLMVTDLQTGLRFWQREVLIGKRGSSRTVTW